MPVTFRLLAVPEIGDESAEMAADGVEGDEAEAESEEPLAIPVEDEEGELEEEEPAPARR